MITSRPDCGAGPAEAGRLCPWNKEGPPSSPVRIRAVFGSSVALRGMADGEKEIRRALDDVQSMIDVCAERLEGLRTQCSTSAELTQQEIRTLEVSGRGLRRELRRPGRKSGPFCRPIIVVAVPLPALSVDVLGTCWLSTNCNSRYHNCVIYTWRISWRVRENLISPYLRVLRYMLYLIFEIMFVRYFRNLRLRNLKFLVSFRSKGR